MSIKFNSQNEFNRLVDKVVAGSGVTEGQAIKIISEEWPEIIRGDAMENSFNEQLEKSKFNNDPALRAEFNNDLASYLAYAKAMAGEQVRIFSK